MSAKKFNYVGRFTTGLTRLKDFKSNKSENWRK